MCTERLEALRQQAIAALVADKKNPRGRAVDGDISCTVQVLSSRGGSLARPHFRATWHRSGKVISEAKLAQSCCR